MLPKFGYEASADAFFLAFVKVVPKILLVVLVVLVTALIAKDILNGLRRPFLNPEKWQALPLVERKVLNHNARRFRFALPHEDQKLGLPAGRHITLRVTRKDGTQVLRPYTPVSEISQRGYVDFVIKIYHAGRMSSALDEVPIGGIVHFKGPKGLFDYQPSGSRAIGMLAGGTGITPMYQLLQLILRNPNDRTEVALIYANVSEEDILLRDELTRMAAKYSDRFKVYHVLNNAPAGWAGGTGFITADMIREHLPAPADDILVLRCGPLPMMAAMEKCLDDLGYSKAVQFQF